MPEIALTPEFKALLDGAGIKASELSAKLAAGAWYTTLLELGSSKQQPSGIFVGHRPEYEVLLETAMQKAIETAIAGNMPLGPAILQGFVDGVTEILRAIEVNTPVKTGRARSSWVATLANGKTIKAIKYTGDEAAYQRRLRRARKKAQRGITS